MTARGKYLKALVDDDTGLISIRKLAALLAERDGLPDDPEDIRRALQRYITNGADDRDVSSERTCPSDHHTYLWRGLSCAAKTSPKYNAVRDKIVRTYAGRRYYCRKGR